MAVKFSTWILALVIGLAGVMIIPGQAAQAEPVVENVALGKPVQASSVYQPNTPYVPENVVDGIWDTRESRWISENKLEPPHWLEIDLLETFVLTSAEVWTGDPTSGRPFAVSEFTLQYWSDGRWLDIPGAEVRVTIPLQPRTKEDEQVVFHFDEPVITDKVRFYSEAIDDGVVRVREIMIFGYQNAEKPGS